MFSLQRDIPCYLVPAVVEQVPLGMLSGNVMCTVNTGNKDAMLRSFKSNFDKLKKWFVITHVYNLI